MIFKIVGMPTINLNYMIIINLKTSLCSALAMNITILLIFVLAFNNL